MDGVGSIASCRALINRLLAPDLTHRFNEENNEEAGETGPRVVNLA